MAEPLTKLEIANIRRSIGTLESFRITCLMAEGGPETVTVDGFTFRDELEAEGYLAELNAALKKAEDARQPKVLKLVLPIQLLSKNRRDKLHYRARHALRQQYQDIITMTCPLKHPTPQVRQRATVTRILGSGERRFDQQNIGAGTAIELIDALTAAGYWVDDSEAWLETRFEQGSRDEVKGPAVVIEIEVL